jgi:CRISPR-associated endonuclease/helicase Cas3
VTFQDYYVARRSRAPFPWMVRLAERFAARDLPDIIDLPTGSGKSDLVVIWAWARTQRADLPRRLWMVSDRRVIVDQTFEVAQSLAADGILVSRLRGGLLSETDAILDPVAAQVICATVDQFGSRLLFRAYGSGPASWPIWAGLAGQDSLVVLDEAHLSPTAEDTIRACGRLGAGVDIISMTATPRVEEGSRFGLTDDDRTHPILGPRLRTRRNVELRQDGSLVAAASELLTNGCQRVAVICNTVREARRVFDDVTHADKHLIIGRQRAIERDRLMERLLPRLLSGAAASPPLVVVATQCIEAGADFDFDGMASEVCPIDALRQRLGRLDRLGMRGEGRCIVTLPQGAREVLPYGTSPVATWRWLRQHVVHGSVDLGGEGWAGLAAHVPEEARSSRSAIVSLLEPHIRALTITSPRPRVEPDIDLLLHGPARAPGAVSLVWRRDVTGDSAAASEILALVPPAASETCEVPLWEVRAWLADQHPEVDAGDIEGARLPTEKDDADQSRQILRWDGQEEGATLIRSNQIRPGDVIVLPAAVGGYDTFGWNPGARQPVEDVADEAYFRRTGRQLERLNDPDAEVSSGRAYRWSGGTVVVVTTAATRSRDIVEVLLADHARAVADEARATALALGLDDDAFYAAGLHHDDGKADPRWQLCIKGGDPARLGEPALAKGNYVVTGLARLPVRWRHEAESLRRLPPDTSDLVRWLVATHHGHGRPFWPIPDHGVGLADLMMRMQRTYGLWGLALHEAVLRCADRQVSRREQDGVGS